LTGYSRSTLSDAELGRHRLRREFWQRCDEALMSDDVLTAAYDRIEALAMAVRRAARSQAQAAREEQASRRLQALLPAPSAEGADGAGPILPVSAGTAPAIAPGEVAPDRAAPNGVAPDGVAPGGGGPGGVAPGGTTASGPGGTTASGIVWGSADPAGSLGLAPAAAVPAAPRVAPDSCAPAGSASHFEGAPHSEGGQSHGGGAQLPLAVVEQCPHCHQPVTVIIVAAPPAAGSPVDK
jgi:hypothetical protein